MIGWRCCPSVCLVSPESLLEARLWSQQRPPFPGWGALSLHTTTLVTCQGGEALFSRCGKGRARFPRHFLVGSGLGSFNTTRCPFQFHYG